MNSLKKAIGAILVATAVLCPLIFSALYHYVFKEFDPTGASTIGSCLMSMAVLFITAMVLLKAELPNH